MKFRIMRNCSLLMEKRTTDLRKNLKIKKTLIAFTHKVYDSDWLKIFHYLATPS